VFDETKTGQDACDKQTVIIFSTWKLGEMKDKGNLTYMRHYEVFFDEVYNVYLLGEHSSFTIGNTKYISLGSPNSYVSLLLAPIRLYKFVSKKNIKVFVTQDQLFSWWTSVLVRILLRAKIFLIPVAMPHVIYESSGRTMTGILPRIVEKLFIKLSFLSAFKLATGKNLKGYVKWLQSTQTSAKKLLIVDLIVDELPSYDFLHTLELSVEKIEREKKVLLYVGRLHKEKLVKDVIESVYLLSETHKDIELWVVGDGREKEFLQNECKKHNIEDRVTFLGFKDPRDLVSIYKKSTVFVSPLTGTALREAGLTYLPIVCYKMDWVKDNFTHKKELIFAEKNNVADLASKIDELLNDDELYNKISKQMGEYAKNNWTVDNLATSLNTLYMESVTFE